MFLGGLTSQVVLLDATLKAPPVAFTSLPSPLRCSPCYPKQAIDTKHIWFGWGLSKIMPFSTRYSGSLGFGLLDFVAL